jgi:hypothetical protein
MKVADSLSSARSDSKASFSLRAAFIGAGVVLIALWGASVMVALASWNDPKEDGFTLVPAFWATLTALPLGLSATISGMSGRDQAMRRAPGSSRDRRWLAAAAGDVGSFPPDVDADRLG